MFGSGGNALVAKTMGIEGKWKKQTVFFLSSSFLLLPEAYCFFRPGLLPYAFSCRLWVPPVKCIRAIYGRTLLLSLPMFVLQRVFQSFISLPPENLLSGLHDNLSGDRQLGLDALFILVLNGACRAPSLLTQYRDTQAVFSL